MKVSTNVLSLALLAMTGVAADGPNGLRGLVDDGAGGLPGADFARRLAAEMSQAGAGGVHAAASTSGGVKVLDRRLDPIPDDLIFQGASCRSLPGGRDPHGDGTNDDGWTLAMGHNDDGSSPAYTIPFAFSFYGVEYPAGMKDVYINNNGNLSFDNPLSTYTPDGFPRMGDPMIAPFWADVDTSEAEANGHVWMKMIGNTLAVTWDNVGYYASNGDKLNSFQALISDGFEPSMGLGNNVCFCYESMEWTTGDITGDNGFGGAPATVGANFGNGDDFFQVGRFNEVGDAYDGPYGNNDGIDYLDDKSFCFNAGGVNIPPIAADFPLDDTVNLDTCQSLDMTVVFLSPEDSQTTSVVVTGAPVGMQITSTSGNDAFTRIQWTPSYGQTVMLTIVATDSAMPDPGVTTKTLIIDATNCGCSVDPLDVQEATASTVESNHFLASWAVDGHSNSRWASYGPTQIDHVTGNEATGNQWLKLDMGEVIFIDSIEIVWERAYSRNYIIKVSEDGASWVTVRTLQATSEGLVQVSLLNVAARYIKIFSTEGDPNYGISIFEVIIFGHPSSVTCAPPPTTCVTTVIPLDTATATASSKENDHKGPEKAIDLDAMSRWSSEFNDDQWLVVDLMELTLITSVWLRWEHAYAKHYKVQVADLEFPEQWNTIVEVMEGEGGSVIHGAFTPVVAQRVRILCEERAMTRYGNSLWEVQVRGNQEADCLSTPEALE